MASPSHRLITSGSLAQLEARLFSALRDAKQGDPFRPVVVLCASRFLGHHLARELARGASGRDGAHGAVVMPHAAIRFLTLNELASELIGDLLAERGAIEIPQGAKGLITRELLATLPKESYFARIQNQPHLPEVLAATFTDIEDSRINPAKAAESTKAKLEDGSSRKLIEIAGLYSRYRKRIADSKMFSESDMLAQAATHSQNFPACFGTDSLPIYGFYELTNAQCEFLFALARHVSLSAFLFVEEAGHFKTTHKLRDRIIHELAPAVENYDREAAESDLIAARSWVFTPRSEAREPDGSLTLLSCPNEVSEAREIARECIRLKRDQQIEFTEMAVLARDSELYLPLLAATFDSVGVPFYLREGLPLDRTAVGKSILALLHLADSDSTPASATATLAGDPGWPRAEVMEWLSLGAVAIRSENRATAHIEPPVAWWDRLSREAGIVSGKQQWQEKLEAIAKRYENEAESLGSSDSKRAATLSNARQARELAKFIAKRIRQAAEWQKLRSWNQLADAVIHALVELHAPGPLRDEVEDALRSLKQLDRAGAASISAFARIAQAVLGSGSERIGRFEGTGVHLVSLSAVRHARFRVVFVPGMTERSFPLLGREDPILLDAERAALNQAVQNGRNGLSHPGLPLKRSRPDEERLLFLLACEAAREKLVLTLPRKEASSGAEKIPSYYVLRLLSTFGAHVGYSDLAKSSAQLTVVPNSRLISLNAHEAIDECEFDLGRIRQLINSGQPLRARYLELRSPNLARAVVSEQRTWHTDVFTEFDGVLPEQRHEILARRFGPERCYPPSMLEQYARCPYHFFLKYVLRLKELEDVEAIESIDARDKGDLMHGILRDFFQRAKDSGKLPLAPRDIEFHRQVLRQICEAHLNKAEAEGITGYRATWELNRKFIAQDLDRYLVKEIREASEWRAERLEMPFGNSPQRAQAVPPQHSGEIAPALILDLGGRTVNISGQIDRLDLSTGRNAVRVVDYKTGKNYSKKNFTLDKGRALQLPLYLLAAQQIFHDVQVENSCAEYQYITRRGGWKTVKMSGTTLIEKRKLLNQVLRTIIDGCTNGLFPRCPGNGGPTDCGKCEFSSIGDPRYQAIWEKKSADPKLADFCQLQEVE